MTIEEIPDNILTIRRDREEKGVRVDSDCTDQQLAWMLSNLAANNDGLANVFYNTLLQVVSRGEESISEFCRVFEKDCRALRDRNERAARIMANKNLS